MRTTDPGDSCLFSIHRTTIRSPVFHVVCLRLRRTTGKPHPLTPLSHLSVRETNNMIPWVLLSEKQWYTKVLETTYSSLSPRTCLLIYEIGIHHVQRKRTLNDDYRWTSVEWRSPILHVKRVSDSYFLLIGVITYREYGTYWPIKIFLLYTFNSWKTYL